MKPTNILWIPLALMSSGVRSANKPLSRRLPKREGLTRFDLDFRGGTPEELVAAIQKCMGKPVNALVPDEFVKTKLPALKLKNVNVAELFQALESASAKHEIVAVNAYSFGEAAITKVIRVFRAITGLKRLQTASDDTIWYFYVDKRIGLVHRRARFAASIPWASYLDRGMTVDDITTAVETGAKMLGETSGPSISFHKGYTSC